MCIIHSNFDRLTPYYYLPFPIMLGQIKPDIMTFLKLSNNQRKISEKLKKKKKPTPEMRSLENNYHQKFSINNATDNQIQN